MPTLHLAYGRDDVKEGAERTGSSSSRKNSDEISSIACTQILDMSPAYRKCIRLNVSIPKPPLDIWRCEDFSFTSYCDGIPKA
jgi:hypothetical protein